MSGKDALKFGTYHYSSLKIVIIDNIFHTPYGNILENFNILRVGYSCWFKEKRYLQVDLQYKKYFWLLAVFCAVSRCNSRVPFAAPVIVFTCYQVAIADNILLHRLWGEIQSSLTNPMPEETSNCWGTPAMYLSHHMLMNHLAGFLSSQLHDKILCFPHFPCSLQSN